MCLYLSLSALHVSDSLVHHQERRFFLKLYIAIGISRYHTSGCCAVNRTTARRTGLYQLRYTAPKRRS